VTEFEKLMIEAAKKYAEISYETPDEMQSNYGHAYWGFVTGARWAKDYIERDQYKDRSCE